MVRVRGKESRLPSLPSPFERVEYAGFSQGTGAFGGRLYPRGAGKWVLYVTDGFYRTETGKWLEPKNWLFLPVLPEASRLYRFCGCTRDECLSSWFDVSESSERAG